MKPFILLHLLALSIALAAPTRAADQYWDTSANSGLQQGDGTWNTGDALWAPAATGTSIGPWVDGNNANFNSLLDGASTILVNNSLVNASLLYIKGARHHLVITNGGELAISGAIIIGYSTATSTNNRLSVFGGEGVTSRLSLALGMTVGYAGSGNALVVDGLGFSDSAVASNGSGYTQGYSGSGSKSSHATVRRGGRLIVRGGNAVVGRNSPHHQLSVSEGGILDAGIVYIGYQGAGNSNTLFITDPDTVVDKVSVLSVGPGRSGNMAIIANGAVLTNVVTFAFGDTATVGSMLMITNGGKMYSAGDVTLGNKNAMNCTGIVSGASSLWNLGAKKLTVGGTASSNTLVIKEGGSASNISLLTVVPSNALHLLGGTLVSAQATLQPGSDCVIGVAAATTPGAGWGFLAVTNGALALGGTLKPTLLDDYVPASSDRFVIMTNEGPGSVAGAFNNAADGQAVPVYGAAGVLEGCSFTVEIGAKGVTLVGYRGAREPGSLMILF